MQDVPAHLWATSNHRLHWREKARRVAALRQIATHRGRAIPAVQPPVHVVAVIGYPTARRADPPNAEPTVKAIIDGLVTARVLPDDDGRVIRRLSFERDQRRSERGTYRVTIRLEEVQP